MQKQMAFVLFGGIDTAKFPRFMHYLREREFLVCIIDEDTERRRLRLACRDSNEQHVFHQAREIVLVEPTDLQAIFRQVNKWRREYSLAGVCTIREHFVTQAALIADFLNLPGPGLRAGHVCRNKLLQRIYLEDWSPPFITLSPAATRIGFESYPAVLKPTGRQASSGVVAVGSDDEVLRELPSYGAHEQLLLETLVAGDEFSVESLVQGGEIVFRNATSKRTNHSHSKQFVELAHTLPAPDVPEGRLTRLYEANRDVIGRLGFQDGVSHAEFKITPDSQVFLMEVAARNPGDGIMPLYQLATGQPLEDALIRIALKEPAGYPEPTRMARQVYFEHPQGRLKDVRLEGFPITPTFFFDTGMRPELDCSATHEPATLRELTVERQRGELLGDILQSRDRCGYFLMDGADAAALDALETEVLPEPHGHHGLRRMDLYLIRHGQSQNNARPERLREEDPSLTEDGRRQADHLAEWIHHLRLTRIITSPFLRTLETTAHLCRRLALTPEVRVDLHEFGGCVAGARLRELTGRPGMTRSQLEDRYPGIKVPAAIDEQGWWKCKPYETDRLARRRAARLLRRTREEFGHSGERVAYVTHADIEVLFLGAVS